MTPTELFLVALILYILVGLTVLGYVFCIYLNRNKNKQDSCVKK